MLQLGFSEDPDLLVVEATGKLKKVDYETMVPLIDRRIEDGGKISILLRLSAFEGWTAGALWEEVKFDLKHLNDVQRVAIVGEKEWERGLATFCRPFTRAEVRFFDKARDEDEARRWVTGRQEKTAASTG